MSITAALAADKQQAFHAPAAASMAYHQTVAQVTIGAETYAAGDKVRAAFGRLVPYDYGVLPVLVVIQNDSRESIRLDQMNAEYVIPRGGRVTATPPGEVRYAHPPHRPDLGAAPPMPIPIKKKNPLGAWEIEGRALAAQMVAPGLAASGFLYFQTQLQNGATIYLSGLTEARSGKELFYFEIPVE
ncbi:MAG: hypothetical protein ABSE42_23635 [Bryobacteraceae bacterium]|jgi:hypothetical protein